MSFAITVAGIGFSPDFMSWWLRALVAEVVAAVPAALVIAPITRRAVGVVFKERSRG